MRSLVEGTEIRKSTLAGGNRLKVMAQTISATFTIAANNPPVVVLDPGGSTRIVLLPPEVEGMFFYIANVEDVSGDLTVKEDSSTTTIATIGPGDIQIFVCTGTTWVATSVDVAAITTATITNLSVSTAGLFANTALQVSDTGGDHHTTIKQNSDEAANRIAKIPALGADDTFAMIGQAQTFAGANTFSGVNIFSAMPRIPVQSDVAATGSVLADAAQLLTGFTVVTGADGTKGVKLPATPAAGSIVIIKGTTAAVLKVWPDASATINAIGSNGAISLASGVIPAIFIAKSTTQWYTIPLLPS